MTAVTPLTPVFAAEIGSADITRAHASHVVGRPVDEGTTVSGDPAELAHAHV